MIASIRTVEVVPLADVLALGPAAWDHLLDHLPIPSPFTTWAWHRAWADAAPPEEVAASRALVLRSDGGEVQALLPFRLVRTRFRRAVVTALRWAIGDVGCPDHLDLPALPEADVGALVPALDGLAWDVMVLENVAERSPNVDRLVAACGRQGWWVRRTPIWRCPHIQLPDSWDAYLATLTPTRRQTVRRKERNLGQRHALTVTDYGPARVREGWDRLRELHARRWEGGGALAGARIERLHLEFGAMLAEWGKLWLTTLDLDGTPAAAWYGFTRGDTVFYYQGGWDPRWDRESVGAVLMGVMIRRAIEAGYRSFDFLRGDEAYKLAWTRAARTCHEVAVIRGGWRGGALRLLDEAAGWRDRIRGRADAVLPEGAEASDV